MTSWAARPHGKLPDVDTTAAGRQTAASIVEAHINGKHMRWERAQGSINDLQTYGLLAGQQAFNETTLPVREQAVNILRCRHGDIVAERIVADLANAGFLRGEAA